MLTAKGTWLAMTKKADYSAGTKTKTAPIVEAAFPVPA
jgi:hypothetical protein